MPSPTATSEARSVTLDGAVRLVVAEIMATMNVSCPGRVIAYYADTQTADVMLCVAERPPSGLPEPFPIIKGCPVDFDAGAGFAWTYPLAPGDPVMVIFADRSLDEWKATGGPVNPQAPHRFHATDAWVRPGGRAAAQKLPATAVSPTNAILSAPGGLRIEMSPAGRMRIGTDGADLITETHDLVQKLESATVATAIGPQPLDAVTLAALAVMEAKLASIKWPT